MKNVPDSPSSLSIFTIGLSLHWKTENQRFVILSVEFDHAQDC